MLAAGEGATAKRKNDVIEHIGTRDVKKNTYSTMRLIKMKRRPRRVLLF